MLFELFHVLSIFFGFATVLCVGLAIYLSRSSTAETSKKRERSETTPDFTLNLSLFRDAEVISYALMKSKEANVLRGQEAYKATVAEIAKNEKVSMFAYQKRAFVKIDAERKLAIRSEERANQIPRKSRRSNYAGRINKLSATIH